MTNEDDFHAALDADPSDWQTRLILADWLEERGDPRADGYRALARRGFAPKHHRPTSSPEHDHWMFQLLTLLDRRESPRWTFDIQNKDETAWFREFCQGVFGSSHRSRRTAEDAAARAFAKLPAARRAKLLAHPAAGAA